MKRKTYKVITHIPIIGDFVKAYTDVPELNGSYARSDEKYNKECVEPFIEFLKSHPDIQPTRKLYNSFLRERKNQNEKT